MQQSSRDNDQRQRLCRDLAKTIAQVAVIAMTFVVIFVFILDDGQWNGNDSADCTATCENSHVCDYNMEERPAIQQPVNAWTSLAYIFVGLWPINHYRVDMSTFIFMLAMFYLGIGGFLYHASLTSVWQTIDEAAMFGALTALIFHGIFALTSIPWSWLALPWMGLVIVFSVLEQEMNEAGLDSKTLSTIIVFIIIAEHLVLLAVGIRKILLRPSTSTKRLKKARQSLKLVLVALLPGVIFGIGLLIREKDSDDEWCTPDSFWQGHAAWHVLTAFAILMIWRFFDRHQMFAMLADTRDYIDEGSDKYTQDEEDHDNAVPEHINFCDSSSVNESTA